jgi:S1-C subfamily serine protease
MSSLKGKIIAVVIILVIAATAYGVGSGAFFTTRDASAQSAVLYNSNTVTSIYDAASPAVFQIQVVEKSSNIFGNSTQEGLGSGFLIDTQGHILTNNHVVESASSVKVVLQNGDSVDAKVLGRDAIDDLAMISVDPSVVSGITPLVLGDSQAVKPGQMAIAIGNPYGLDDTVTVGIISGLNRTVSGSNLRGMLQTDASLNPGNSGGPLLDASGSVIGINTAIEATTSGASNIGFAVPSNVAKNVLSDLLASRTITRPWLGISGRALTQSVAQNLGLTVNEGVYVVSLTKDSPAEKAGLKSGSTDSSGNLGKGGDVITAVDGKAVKTVEAISSYLLTKKVGDTVTLSVLRDGSSLSLQVTLGTWPTSLVSETSPNTNPQQPSPDNTPNIPGWNWRFYGR